MLLVIFLISSTYGYQRLSTDVYPKKYHLVLHPSFESDYRFHGNLSIQLVMNNTNTFSLDCEDLQVTSTILTFDGEWQVNHKAVQQNNRLHVTSSKLMKDSYQVEFNISFHGFIRKDLTGFYLSTYEYNGTQRILGSTQFESTGARKAFPCFDEPSFRADFSLEILVQPNMSVISNMPAISNNVRNGLRRIIFAERPSTPTYLVAWVIYETDSFVSTSKNFKTDCHQNSSLEYSIWSSSMYQNETSLALNSAPGIVSALENFTGIHCEAVKYKMDLVAIPDFQAGAMENWELITFRESALLYNNKSSTVWDKQHLLMIVAHELAHQWFGNLVTPHWWSFTWLNEGFARYLQYVIADQLYPEMKLNEQFLVDRRQLALLTDDSYAHSLTNENITSEDAISDMFDIITYDKGGSVIHMWRSTIGYETFHTRIKNYLNTVVSSGGVSDPEYLFSQLFNSTNKQLGTTWTLQNGYPIIVVTEGNGTLTLKQIKVTNWNKTEAGHWFIPVTININSTTHSFNMEPNKSLEIKFDQNTSYLININQTGYYRVMYNSVNRWLPTNTTDVTSSMLIDDALALSKLGLMPYATTMTVASHHLKSMGYLPWVTALRAFSTVHDILKNSEQESKWRKLVLDLMDDIMVKVALNDSLTENHVLKLHKMNLLKHGCNYGHDGCLNEASKLAMNLSYGTPEKRSALLCTVVRKGNEKTWNEIYERYQSSGSPTEKQLYLKALTCTSNRTMIQKFLQLMLTNNLQKHDVTSTIALICESPVGAEETLAFLKKNYTQINNYFGESRTARKILSTATKFISESLLDQIKGMASTLTKLNMEPIINKLDQELTLKKQNIKMISKFLSPNQTEVTTENDKEIPSSFSDNSSCKINVEIAWIISFIAIFSLKSLYDTF